MTAVIGPVITISETRRLCYWFAICCIRGADCNNVCESRIDGVGLGLMLYVYTGAMVRPDVCWWRDWWVGCFD